MVLYFCTCCCFAYHCDSQKLFLCFWKYNNERGRGSILPNHEVKELLHFCWGGDDGKIHIVCDQQSKLKKRANGINIDWDITMLPCSRTHNWPKIKRVRYLLPFCIFLSYSKTFPGFFWKYNNGRGRGSVWPNHAVINNKLCARGVTNKILLNRQEHPFLLYTT